MRARLGMSRARPHALELAIEDRLPACCSPFPWLLPLAGMAALRTLAPLVPERVGSMGSAAALVPVLRGTLRESTGDTGGAVESLYRAEGQLQRELKLFVTRLRRSQPEVAVMLRAQPMEVTLIQE